VLILSDACAAIDKGGCGGTGYSCGDLAYTKENCLTYDDAMEIQTPKLR
jgi:hypothetical protein